MAAELKKKFIKKMIEMIPFLQNFHRNSPKFIEISVSLKVQMFLQKKRIRLAEEKAACELEGTTPKRYVTMYLKSSSNVFGFLCIFFYVPRLFVVDIVMIRRNFPNLKF